MKKVTSFIIKHLRIPFFSLLTLSLAGCSRLFYDRYQVFEDEFKNTKKIITRMELRPIERRTEIGNAKIIFEREYSNHIDFVKAYCVIDRSSSSFKAEDKGFLKIDNDVHEINLQGIVSEQKISTETAASTFTRNDSIIASSGSNIYSGSRIWIDDKFIFILSQDMIQKTEFSNKLLIRIYFGPIPATYRIKGCNLRLLKMTLSM